MPAGKEQGRLGASWPGRGGQLVVGVGIEKTLFQIAMWDIPRCLESAGSSPMGSTSRAGETNHPTNGPQGDPWPCRQRLDLGRGITLRLADILVNRTLM